MAGEVIMITKVLNHAQLQLLDEIVGNAKLACEDKEKACLLGGVLSFIRIHENYDSDSRIYKVELSETIWKAQSKLRMVSNEK